MSDAQDLGWAILELMGHRKLAGHLTMDGPLYRIDVYVQDEKPEPDGELPDMRPIATQWYGQAAIYCITATTKENCLALTRSHQPAPISRWELPAPEHEPEHEYASATVLDDEDEADEDLGY